MGHRAYGEVHTKPSRIDHLSDEFAQRILTRVVVDMEGFSMSAHHPWPPICPHCGKGMVLSRADARGYGQSVLHVYECLSCQVWYTCGEPETDDEGAVITAPRPIQPRRLCRRDWSAISIKLRSYFTNLVKGYERDSEALFDRVISIVEQNRAIR